MLALLLVATLGFDAGGPEGRRLREEGRLQLGRLAEMSRLPSSGACWKDAVRSLTGSCEALSGDAQAAVGLRLTDCFLLASGRPPTGCGGDEVRDRVRCTAAMAPEAFHAYTVFYTHTQSICFFLRGELWHEETERTIERLAAASAQVTFHMETVTKFLGVSHESLMAAVAELRSWSLGEASWFRALAFYLAALAASWVAGASPRTVGARPWLCLALTLNLAAECWLLSWAAQLLGLGRGSAAEEEEERARTWASWARKATVAVCVALVAAKWLLYRDLATENNRLLKDVKADTTRLLGELRQTKNQAASYGTQKREDRYSATTGYGTQKWEDGNSSTTGYSTQKWEDRYSATSRYGTQLREGRFSGTTYSPLKVQPLGERRFEERYSATTYRQSEEPGGTFRYSSSTYRPPEEPGVTSPYSEETAVQSQPVVKRPRGRPRSRPQAAGYRKLNGSYGVGEQESRQLPLQRSSTPLPDVDVSEVSLLTKRDFYTPDRQLQSHQDPRLRATPVVVLRPLEMEERSRRGSSMASNVSNHSYSLRSVQHV